MTINDALPLKATQRDVIAKSKSFWSFTYELQTNSMPFHLDSLWGDTLMPLTADGRRSRILRVAKTPVLFKAVCGPKFMKFWDTVADPL